MKAERNENRPELCSIGFDMNEIAKPVPKKTVYLGVEVGNSLDFFCLSFLCRVTTLSGSIHVVYAFQMGYAFIKFHFHIFLFMLLENVSSIKRLLMLVRVDTCACVHHADCTFILDVLTFTTFGSP